MASLCLTGGLTDGMEISTKKKKKERRRKVQRDCLSLRVRGLKMLHLFSSVQSSSQH